MCLAKEQPKSFTNGKFDLLRLQNIKYVNYSWGLGIVITPLNVKKCKIRSMKSVTAYLDHGTHGWWQLHRATVQLSHYVPRCALMGWATWEPSKKLRESNGTLSNEQIPHLVGHHALVCPEASNPVLGILCLVQAKTSRKCWTTDRCAL